jgi:hypothetical protein
MSDVSFRDSIMPCEESRIRAAQMRKRHSEQAWSGAACGGAE